ncbi:MAG: hypothetical protein JWQ95_5523 [Sphaerisporangium sp.]|nr:hypothetical protein [Sphaerisporangium sp.]
MIAGKRCCLFSKYADGRNRYACDPQSAEDRAQVGRATAPPAPFVEQATVEAHSFFALNRLGGLTHYIRIMYRLSWSGAGKNQCRLRDLSVRGTSWAGWFASGEIDPCSST